MDLRVWVMTSSPLSAPTAKPCFQLPSWAGTVVGWRGRPSRVALQPASARSTMTRVRVPEPAGIRVRVPEPAPVEATEVTSPPASMRLSRDESGCAEEVTRQELPEAV